MLRISDITLRRAAKVLFESASMIVHPGHKVGLVGPNGSGKSSLFALVRGELHADAGEVSMPPRWVLSHVAQETPALERAALEFVIDGDAELREIEAAIEGADEEDLAHLHARYDEIGGYQARARAQTLLAGLGFDEPAQALPVAQFSGGWRMRLNLARALMCRSDLLLLDEPTNHLDLDAVLWLEDWLRAFPGAVILITHDREFLDAVVEEIVHVENQAPQHVHRATTAPSKRSARRASHCSRRRYEKQRRTIEHLEAFITRFRAKATKASQAQSRIRALEKMERIAAAHVDSPFHFEFRAPPEKPRQLFRLEEAAVGYGGKPVLSGIEWSVLPGDAIGLLGPNGAGKSTLLKAIVGKLRAASGEMHRAQGLRIGYFAQHQVDQLRLDEIALWHMEKLASRARAGVPRLPRRLRLPRRPGDPEGRELLGRREGAPRPRAHRVAAAEPAAPRRAHQPPRHRHARSARRGAHRFRGRAHRGRARPAPALGGHRPVDARGRRQGGAVRGRPRRLQGVGEGVSTRAARGRDDRAGAVSRKDERRAEADARQREADARKPFEKKLAAIEARARSAHRGVARDRGLARHRRSLRGSQPRTAAG